MFLGCLHYICSMIIGNGKKCNKSSEKEVSDHINYLRVAIKYYLRVKYPYRIMFSMNLSRKSSVPNSIFYNSISN